MIHTHLTEEEIQEYVLNKAGCTADNIMHLASCHDCQARADQYAVLFSGIEEQEKPVFDFDVAAFIMPQLSEPAPAKTSDKWISYFIFLICALPAAVLLYFFRGLLKSMVSGMTPIIIYLVITTVVLLLGLICFDMYSRYEQKMKALNYY